MANNVSAVFSYKWYSRFFWIPWSLGWFLLGVYISMLAHIKNVRPDIGEIMFLWTLLSLLIVVGFVFGRRMMVILGPIQISNDGVKGRFQDDGFEFWPKPNPGFIGWSNVERFDEFGYPDMDSLKMGRKSGIRLVSTDGKKIIIYEHIKKYDGLLSRIKMEVEKTKFGKAL